MASVIKIIATKEETTDPVELKDVVDKLIENGNKWIALEEDIAKVEEAVTQLSDPKTGLVTEINAVLTGNTKSIDDLKKVSEKCKTAAADAPKEDAKLSTLFCIIKDLFITKNTKRKYWVEAFLENIKNRIADISTDILDTKEPYVNAKMGIGKMQAFANSEERDNQKKRLFEYNIKKEKKVAMRKKLRQIIKMLEKLPNSILKNQDNDILKILVQHLEKDEDKKFKLRDTINLRNKKFDPTSLINNYGKFEDANITIEIDNKNPIMSRLREISSEKGLRELYICYGDDKETGCWIYPPKRFESFQDIIKRGEKIEIKVSFPSNEKKKNLYKNVMIDKAKKKGIDIKDMYKINYTNINKEAISPKKIKGKNGAKEDKNADPIFILHPKHLKIVKLDCLYSDGIAVGETVRLYLFDKYDEFNDERHGDVARLMIEEPKTKQITIAEVKTNLTYIIENNIMLPNKPEILFNYKELALKQNNTEIVDSMKGLKNVYNYSGMYAIRNSYNLNYIMFKKEPKEWDDFYNTCKIKSKDETDQTTIDNIFLFVVNGKGSNQSLRINEKYGTLFFNFSSIDKTGPSAPAVEPIDTNIKNINKVLMEKFKDHWENLAKKQENLENTEYNEEDNIFRLNFDGNETDVFILTIKQLQDLITGNEKREKEKEMEVNKQDSSMKRDEENKKNNTAKEIKISYKDSSEGKNEEKLNKKINEYRKEINKYIETMNYWNQIKRDEREVELHYKQFGKFIGHTMSNANHRDDDLYDIEYFDEKGNKKNGKIKIQNKPKIWQVRKSVPGVTVPSFNDVVKNKGEDRFGKIKYEIKTEDGTEKYISIEKIIVKKKYLTNAWLTDIEKFLDAPFKIVKDHIEKFKKFAKQREPLNLMEDKKEGEKIFELWITPDKHMTGNRGRFEEVMYKGLKDHRSHEIDRERKKLENKFAIWLTSISNFSITFYDDQWPKAANVKGVQLFNTEKTDVEKVEKILQNGQVEKKEQKEQYTFYDNLTSVEKKIIEKLKTDDVIKQPLTLKIHMERQNRKMSKSGARWKREREKAAKKLEKLKSELKLAKRFYEDPLPENWPKIPKRNDKNELRILCPSVKMFKYKGDKRYKYTSREKQPEQLEVVKTPKANTNQIQTQKENTKANTKANTNPNTIPKANIKANTKANTKPLMKRLMTSLNSLHIKKSLPRQGAVKKKENIKDIDVIITSVKDKYFKKKLMGNEDLGYINLNKYTENMEEEKKKNTWDVNTLDDKRVYWTKIILNELDYLNKGLETFWFNTKDNLGIVWGEDKNRIVLAEDKNRIVFVANLDKGKQGSKLGVNINSTLMYINDKVVLSLDDAVKKITDLKKEDDPIRLTMKYLVPVPTRPATPPVSRDIAEGWSIGLDPESGTQYYYNTITGKSQWGNPTGLPAPTV